MKLGILTSSRADYGIYQPLLAKLKADTRFELEIITFGMHLQVNQGNTIEIIKKDGFNKIHSVGSMPEDDTLLDIALGYGTLVKDFALFWNEHQFDLVFALGDRWEMSAAVQASLPFEIKLAHIHGGETTLGAIDNVYRHQISLAAVYHFTAAQPFSTRLSALLDKTEGIYTVGSISLEDLESTPLPDWQRVKQQFEIPFDEFVLVTFHPESVGAQKNGAYSQIAFEILEKLSQSTNILITKANSDAMGSLYNKQFEKLEELHPAKVKLVSSLGKLNYFKAMQQCFFMLGNTSSGIVESASFKKWVINVGDRQKGRLRNANVIDVEFNLKAIHEAVNSLEQVADYKGENKYLKANTTGIIINVISKDAGL